MITQLDGYQIFAAFCLVGLPFIFLLLVIFVPSPMLAYRKREQDAWLAEKEHQKARMLVSAERKLVEDWRTSLIRSNLNTSVLRRRTNHQA